MQFDRYEVVQRLIDTAAIFGVLLSSCTACLAFKFEEDDEYEVFCDIGVFSCSKVLQSEYNYGFGLVAPLLGKESNFYLPNGVFGVFFYTFVLFLAWTLRPWCIKLHVMLVFFSNTVLAWLAYALLFKVQELCILCIALYFSNVMLSVLTIIRFRQIEELFGKPATSGTKKKAPAKKGRSKKD